jgi:hypothetical protein
MQVKTPLLDGKKKNKSRQEINWAAFIVIVDI